MRAFDSDKLGTLLNVSLEITAQLGSRRMQLRELIELGPNSIIELDRSAGAPVDILANDALIARGEIIAIDQNFGVRITELIDVD